MNKHSLKKLNEELMRNVRLFKLHSVCKKNKLGLKLRINLKSKQRNSEKLKRWSAFNKDKLLKPQKNRDKLKDFNLKKQKNFDYNKKKLKNY
jgi:fructosamine-3-kinase